MLSIPQMALQNSLGRNCSQLLSLAGLSYRMHHLLITASGKALASHSYVCEPAETLIQCRQVALALGHRRHQEAGSHGLTPVHVANVVMRCQTSGL